MRKTLEFKSASKEQGRFSGFAPYGAEFAPGAFAKSLAESRGLVKIVPHPDSVEAVGIATIREASDGLHIEAQLELALQGGRDAYLRVSKKLVDGISFEVGGPVATRHGRITEAKLWSISLCTFAHAAAARITDVKRNGNAGELRDLLSALQGANLAIRERDRENAAALKELLVQLKFKKLDSLFSQI